MMKKSTNQFGAFAWLLAVAAWLLCGETAHANYRAKAEEAMGFIQSSFYDADAKLYRAATPATLSGSSSRNAKL